MNRKRYTDAFKEQVVKDRKENGMSEREVAEKYGIAKSTVHSWTRRIIPKGKRNKITVHYSQKNKRKRLY